MSEKEIGVTKQVREEAYKIISSRNEGIRFSELTAELRKRFPSFNRNMINTQVAGLRNHPDYQDKLESKDSVGKIFRAITPLVEPPSKSKEMPPEKEFYGTFASYLVEYLKDCTVAKKYGGSPNKRGWSNPDVVGIYNLSMGSVFRRDPEIVSAEIKISSDYNVLKDAFSQAAFYLLFSHKSYIVIPNTASPETLNILESLSIAFGIGLVLFDSSNKDDPDYTLRNRAQRHEPEIEYLNKDGVRIIKFLEEGGDSD